MRLSYNDIENYAIAELYRFMSPAIDVKGIKPILIGTFASSLLNLRLEYTRLSDDGKMLGITTYSDMDIDLYRYCRKETISVPAKTVLIDERLKPPLMWGIPDNEFRRRQFTIAHECAHHILYRIMPDNERREFDKRYSARTMSLYELKSVDDWYEWQANALAAALIMPKKYIELLLGSHRLILYGRRMNKPDDLRLNNMCSRLGVSRTMLTLRLKQLGYLLVLPSSEYYDPTDIECDDDFYTAQEAGGKAYG